MFVVLSLWNLVVDLMVDVVELVPAVVDVSFPFGSVLDEKGLVGLRKLLRFPYVNPAPFKAYVFLVECLGLEKCFDVCAWWK